MNGHTPEPWEARPNGAAFSIARLDEPHHMISVGMIGQPDGKHEANTERIVACVNGCEGIADPSAVGDVLEASKAILKILSQDRTSQNGEYSIAEAYGFEDDELRTLQEAVDKAGAD